MKKFVSAYNKRNGSVLHPLGVELHGPARQLLERSARLSELVSDGDDLYCTKLELLWKTCTRRGCNLRYSDRNNEATSCSFHHGQPIFHEGSKGWTCCSARALNFDEIFTIPGCTTGFHSDSEEIVKPIATTVGRAQVASKTIDGKEVFAGENRQIARQVVEADNSIKIEEQDQDPLGVVVPIGAPCQRNGCSAKYEGEHTRNNACWYHRGVPIFHDGSKGWSCCKSNVADFDDIFRIEGCTEGLHMFTPKKPAVMEVTHCRVDYYQSALLVTISVYAKDADPSATTVRFEATQCHIHVVYKDLRVYDRTLNFPEAVNVAECAFRVAPMKIELRVAKTTGNDWYGCVA
jgi:hypothetical protein